jgi:prepilin-type N-terminal cleavage/methylation domain-containing protein
MSLKQTKSRGFTIVELLIVIVVIAILAAITIVAYNGIQNRAKTSAGQAAANTVIKKAEAANAVATGYPTVAADFAAQADSSLTGSGITLGTITAGTVPPNNNTVEYKGCTTPAGTGASVSYYDSTQSGANTKVTKNIGATCTAAAAAISQAY